jgi:hypothetical protein
MSRALGTPHTRWPIQRRTVSANCSPQAWRRRSAELNSRRSNSNCASSTATATVAHNARQPARHRCEPMKRNRTTLMPQLVDGRQDAVPGQSCRPGNAPPPDARAHQRASTHAHTHMQAHTVTVTDRQTAGRTPANEWAAATGDEPPSSPRWPSGCSNHSNRSGLSAIDSGFVARPAPSGPVVAAAQL